MSTARDRLAAALPIGSIDDRDMADAILAADPALGDALALGLAWAEVESLLPEGWLFQVVGPGSVGYQAAAWEIGGHSIRQDGPTPALALTNLADRLREKAR